MCQWGKFNTHNHDLSNRYIGDMSPEQDEVFALFKKWIADENVTQNPWHDDTFLLKFARARKFDLQKMMIMFGDYMNYRKEHNIDSIITVSTCSE